MEGATPITTDFCRSITNTVLQNNLIRYQCFSNNFRVVRNNNNQVRSPIMQISKQPKMPSIAVSTPKISKRALLKRADGLAKI
jgi:hypothetical protein